MIAALPIDPHLPDIVAAARTTKALVLGAPAGTGKTTRVPGALVDAGLAGKVIVLEPRRLAARAAARRVAEERGEALGAGVGYRVRHERQTSAKTRIEFVTEGVLVRQLLADPTLPGVGAVVLDEFHERHLEGDLALAMLQEVRATVRDDLVLVVMSATLDPGPLLAYLPGSVAMQVASPLHPVEVVWLERKKGREMFFAARDAVRRALAETAGHVLVFLPGAGEIRAVMEELDATARAQGLLVLPLHGQLPADQQDLAVRPSAARKVVLSTNVAESSLTIEGVTAVVDSGLARVLRFDAGRGLDVLRLETISRASADQRKGRAGRTAPGICYRLWSKADERAMPEADTPEVRRVDLCGPALEVRAFAGRDPRDFAWLEAPEAGSLRRADDLLLALGALEPGTRRVSALGHRLLELPLHPRLARVVVAAAQDAVAADGALAAAILGERDFLRGDLAFGDEQRRHAEPKEHDLLGRMELFAELEDERFGGALCRSLGADRNAAMAVARARDQILAAARGGRGVAHAGRDAAETLRRCVLAGFPDRVGIRAAGAREATLCGGRGALLPELGARDPHELFVALAVRETDGRAGARAAVEVLVWIERAWLEELFPDELRSTVEATFDEDRLAVVTRRVERYRDLVLAEARGGEPDPERARDLLAARLAEDPWRWLGDEKAARPLRDLCARIAWLRERAPELCAGLGLEAPSTGVLAQAAAATLGPAQSLRDLVPARVHEAVLALITPQQRHALGQHAPAELALPTGRRARVEYGAHGPSVAVRMQELFGLPATPRLAGGRVPVTIELLAPNHRPVQITQDLASFWKNVYPQVRSELRRKYPRHDWPENPLTAAPQARPRRRER